ncbi:glycosyltransferase [Tichowtungia aerotolerans]|uniref:Glycosyltransferase n=1 Tax=Tichowtungia aerotolerans TaxID=2697043 RepID=A0A6P1M317_9BACT|nr:glycosyltransferase [Tichowtungia aerotolerans]QHI69000.1 glycosyltransferase [Tichowtungia aerotolerans]
MKILFLTLKLPHSEVVGGNRIVFQRIRYLAQQGHQVGLVSYLSGETEKQIEGLKEFVFDLHTIQQPNRNLLFRIFHDYLWAHSRPALIWKLYSKAMMDEVANAVELQHYDLVIAEFSEMGQFLYKNPSLSAVHTVISCHRCMTASYEKYQEMEEVRWRLYCKSLPQLRGLRKYEFDMYRSADRILVLTPQDRFTMQYYAPDLAVSVAPTGVDIEELQKHPPVPKEPIILMTGYMQDPANEDGVKWFVHHVWPALRDHHPEVKFYIVGADPSPRIKRLVAGDRRIIVTGKVKDLRPYRNRARVLVSPVRLGSGMRTKVLEAMAAGLPVVSTSLGMAGIEAQTGMNCFVADTPALFERSVDWLLTDRSLSARMAHAARKLIEEKYGLEIGLHQFENILKSVVEG